MVTLRAATPADQESIRSIYNDAVLHTTATFDTDIRTTEQQANWFRAHKKNHPVIVAEESGTVVGWASLSSWSDRCAYDGTVEVSEYIHPDHRGRGIGSQLLREVMRLGKEAGNHSVLARISEGNATSIHMHEKFGFAHIGVMKEVGFKFGRYLDVHLMQLTY